MAMIKEWLHDFLVRHRSRLRPGDWPEPGSEDERDFGRPWLSAFVDLRIRESEAEIASSRLARNPPNFAREHLPALLAEVRALREAAAAQAAHGVIAESIQAAKQQSQGCGWCGGLGLRPVFHPRYVGTATILVEREDDRGEVRMQPAAARVAAHCICPLGRYMRAEAEDDYRGRIPDLQRVLNGQSAWLPHDPTRPDDGPAIGAEADRREARAGVGGRIDGDGDEVAF